jgi:hypothetical protein
MRQIATLIIILVTFACLSSAYGQKKTFKTFNQKAFGFEEKITAPTIVCYASGEVGINHIPPPKAYYESLVNGRTEALTDIEVTYVGDMPEEAKKAFEFAVSIWEKMLISSVKIRIQANWTPLGARTLGSARPGTYFRSPLMPKFPAWYPLALYEKITGRNVNGNEFDIIANFSSNNMDWYFGTDGATPRTQYDFVTVVLHELGHGLGFTGAHSVSTSGTTSTGAIGINTIPVIYDTYIANEAGSFLVDTTVFKNPSPALAREFVSRTGLFFDAPYVTQRNARQRVKLNTPGTFSGGSSISHLDPTIFNGTDNALMRPAIGLGEFIQDPGPVVMNMFAEMGWVLTQVKHTPLDNTDQVQKPIDFKANLVSDTTIDLKKYTVTLVYSEDRFRTEKREAMQLVNNQDFTFQLPAPNADKEYLYYFSAKDANGAEIALPSTKNTRPFGFVVANDNDAPVIAHTPDGFVLENVDTLLIGAQITDRLGVDTAYIEYSINDQALITIPMLDLGEDNFANLLTFSAGMLTAGGTIKYRITAIDVSSKKNKGISPATGFHTLRVEGFGQARASYENNFDIPSDDFIGNAYRIETADGFNNGAIHSDHPYKDGTGPGDQSDYIYQLKFPIKIKDKDAFMLFDEVVLVEPGERGTVFGDFEFWDYVIVEASQDKGKTWSILLDGYDSRANADWLSAYNRRIVDNNSTTVGTPALFRPRSINLLDKLRPNDEVIIRFRLFADQAANGWGWAIDNLKIQTAVVGLSDYLVYQGDIQVYPNPNQGTFNFVLNNSKLGEVHLQLYNILGSEVKNFQFIKTDQTLRTELNVGNLTKGIYFLHIRTKDGEAVRKIMID